MKKMIQIYAVYKRLILGLKTHTGFNWKDGKRCTMQILTRKAGVVILISDTVDVRVKKLTKEIKTHYMMIKAFYNEDIHP